MSQEKILRVYADGVFDGFHIGHSNMLKQCREAFPNQKIWLIAGVCDQEDIEDHKGIHIINSGPTIYSESERIAMVKQNRYVDEVHEHAPWVLTESTLLNTQNSFLIITSILSATMIFPIILPELMMRMQSPKLWEDSKQPKGLKEFQQPTW